VFNADVPEETRGTLLRAHDDGDLSASETATVARKLDGLSTTDKQRAVDLIEETDGSGAELVAELDDDALQRVLNLDIDAVDEFRTAAARHVDAGNADPDDVAKFARHADNLEGIEGLNSGPVDKFVNTGKKSGIQGAVREVEVADDIGAENIDRMNIEVGGKSEIAEFDIKRTDGSVVEVKKTFGSDKRNVFDEIETQLDGMREHPDTVLDGNQLVIRADEVRNTDSVQDVVDYWENELSKDKWGNANVDIRVIEDSAGKVVAD